MLNHSRDRTSSYNHHPKQFSVLHPDVCKQIHDINHSTLICLFESGKCGKEAKNINKFEYLEKVRAF